MRRVGFILIAALSPFSLTGCVELLGAAGSGAVVTAEVCSLRVCRENHVLPVRSIRKKALLVALSRMQIVADKAVEVEGGEKFSPERIRWRSRSS